MTARSGRAGENIPRFNHYVPRFILENFARSGKVSVFDKHTHKRFKLPPYRAMGEKDFNNVRLGDNILSFEGRFTYLEDRAAPVIAKVVQHRTLRSLAPMEETILHTFVVVQLLRSKRRRLDHIKVGAEIRRRWPDLALNPLKDEMPDEEFEKLFSLNFAFSKLNDLTAPLVTKHSFLMIKDCDGELYVSDSPAVMHNSKEYGPYGNIGLAVPNIEIYLPLSHEIVLAYMCPLTMKETEETLQAAEKEIGSAFGRKFLSPSGISVTDRLEIEQSRAEIERAKSYYAMIKSERAVPMSSENLLFLNSLQILSSHRYLACRANDFTFAVRALSEKPHWKEGLGIKIG